MIELQCLGPLRFLDSGGRELTLTRQPRRAALLAYLALASRDGLHRRDKLIAVFWPEKDARQARNALSQALHVIRGSIGPDAITTTGDEIVALNRSLVTTDVAAFDAAIAMRDEERALRLYRGDFLDGFYLSDAVEFERWVESERERLRRQAIAAAFAMADKDVASRQSAETLVWILRAVDIASYEEADVKEAMLRLEQIGQHGAALRLFDTFRSRLIADCGVEPGAAIRTLAERIRSGALESAYQPISPAPRENRAATPPSRIRRGVVGWKYAAMAGVIAVGGALWSWHRSSAEDAAPAGVMLDLSRSRPVAQGVAGPTLALSPDGRRLAYIGVGDRGNQLFLRPLDSLAARPIPNTGGARFPFFSPDGEWLGFEQRGRLLRVRLDRPEDTALTIVASPQNIRGASWAPGDVIVFASDSVLWRTSTRGENPRPFARRDTIDGVFRWPDVLPDTQAVLFTITSIDGSRIAIASLETGMIRYLGIEGSSARFVSPRRVVYATNDGVLLAAQFDPERSEIAGPSIPIADGVFVGNAGAAKVGIAQNGTIVYQREDEARRLVKVDRLGRTQLIQEAPRGFGAPRLSPDARRLAVAVSFAGPSRENLWLLDLDRRLLERLTWDSTSLAPVWSPDGRALLYATMRGGSAPGFSVRQLQLGDTGGGEALLQPAPGQFPLDVDRHGGALLLQRYSASTGWDLWVLTAGRRRPQPWLVQAGNQHSATISPNGHWVAYVSNESGRDEIYVRPFSGTRPSQLVSRMGGREPRWAASGKELFFRTASGMMSAHVEADPLFRVVTTRLLFEDAQFARGWYTAKYDVHPDGRHFFMVQRGSAESRLVLLKSALAP